MFTSTADEAGWGRERTNDDQHLLVLVAWLKCYQRLGYFPKLAEVPAVAYLRSSPRRSQSS